MMQDKTYGAVLNAKNNIHIRPPVLIGKIIADTSDTIDQHFRCDVLLLH